MKAFTSRGTLNIPVPQKMIKPVHKPNLKPFVIESCYCNHGHNLISNDVIVDDHKGILLKVKSGRKTGHIALSAVCGNKTRIDLRIQLIDNALMKFFCPVCGEALPVYSPCECGASMIALFLDRELSFSNCIGICNRVGCKHSVIIRQNELLICSGLAR
ncbi:MAG: hypothetical protein V2A67_03030 [Bacteroidota bacterium]